jgi:hypothetical protein
MLLEGAFVLRRGQKRLRLGTDRREAKGGPEKMRVGDGMPTHYYFHGANRASASSRTFAQHRRRRTAGPLRGRGVLGGSSVPAVSQRRDAARALAPVSLAWTRAVAVHVIMG